MTSTRELIADDDKIDQRPPPVDLSHLYSDATRERTLGVVKGLYKYFRIPNIQNIAGGLPNYNYFPFDTLEATAALPDRWKPTPNKRLDSGPSLAESFAHLQEQATKGAYYGTSAGKSRVLVPKNPTAPEKQMEINIKSALQYGTAQGYPPLYNYLHNFTTKNLHPNVHYQNGPDIILTTGSTDGFAKTLEALNNPWNRHRDKIEDREGLLVEEFAYMTPVQAAKARGMNVVPVAVDGQGMCNEGVGGLLDVLENWDTKLGKRPHLLYTVTIGQNPTSGVLSLFRRRAIYDLCVKYDVIIIEDDPYWFLQYPSANELSLKLRNEAIAHDVSRIGDPYWPLRDSRYVNGKWHRPDIRRFEDLKSSGYPFIDSLVPSYLAVDYQGRVVRLDTFSKTIAPGCRLGWITTQPAICERLLRITETQTAQPSGFVQSVVAELLIGPQESRENFNIWQTDGWVRWLEGLRGEYERRMHIMCTILEEGKDLVVDEAPPPNSTDPAVSSPPPRRRCAPLRDSHRTVPVPVPVPTEPNKTVPSSDLKIHHHRSQNKEYDDQVEVSDEWTHVAKKQLYSFPIPSGGMFIWIRIHFETHPLFPHYNNSYSCSSSPSSPSPSTETKSADTDENDGVPPPLTPLALSSALFVHLTTRPYRVLVCPGVMFASSTQIYETKGWQYIRLCFAAVDTSEVEMASRRFVQGVRDFWAIGDVEVVEALRGGEGNAKGDVVEGEGGGMSDFVDMRVGC